MDFTSILMQMVVLFLLVIVGYVANKIGVMDNDFNRRLTNLVLTFAMPAMILDSVINSENSFSLSQIGSIVVVSIVSYAVAIALALVVSRLLRTPPDQIGILQFMLIFGNVGFIGFPVAGAIFGSDAVFYASIFNLPFNLMVFTFGVFLVAGGGSRTRLSLREILSPGVIASLLSLVIALTQVQLPAVVGDTVALLGQITTPAALLIIGSNLAKLPLRSIAGGPRIWAMSAVRLLIGPLLLWLLLRGWVSDPMILGVAVVLQGMPVASYCTMIALQYNGDSDSAGQGTFLTTLLAIVTIPLLTLLL